MKHEVKQPLRLENGTFMRGEVEVPIEIGNAEQIALLQKIERDMRIRETGRCRIRVRYNHLQKVRSRIRD